MKIFYEATSLFGGKGIHKTGIAIYVDNIYRNLVKLDSKDEITLHGLCFITRHKWVKRNFPFNTKFAFISFYFTKKDKK